MIADQRRDTQGGGLVAARGPMASTLRPRLRRVFPGQECELRELRRWLAGVLPEGGARDDLLIIAVELATNAIKHTASGRGGFFAVELSWDADQKSLRLAVADGGARHGPCLNASPDPLDEHGRGLAVVQALASQVGVLGDRRGRVVWAERPLPLPPRFASGPS